MKSLSNVIKESMNLTEGFNSRNMYFYGKGKYQKEYDALYDELVPVQGEANTPEGEALRCATEIYHENMNNGNCNVKDERGRVCQEFQEYFTTLHNFFARRKNKEARPVLDYIKYKAYQNCDDYNSVHDEQFEKLMDLTIEEILKTR